MSLSTIILLLSSFIASAGYIYTYVGKGFQSPDRAFGNTGIMRTTSLPCRVIRISSPAATASISAEKCCFASKTPVVRMLANLESLARF